MAALTRAVNDTLGLADTPTRLNVAAAGGDLVSVRDTVNTSLTSSLSPAVADTLGLTDARAVAAAHGRTLADTAGTSDSPVRQGRFFFGDEPLGLTDQVDGELTGGDLSALINDSAGLVDLVAASNTLTDELGPTDSPITQGFTAHGVEIVGLVDSVTAGIASPAATRTATDELGITDSPISQGVTAVGVDPFPLTDTAVAVLGAGVGRDIADTLGLTDVGDPLRIDVEETTADPLALTDTLSAETSGVGDAGVTDPINLSDTVGRSLHITITDAMGATDQRAPEPGRGITDTVALSDTAGVMRAVAVLMSEEYLLTDTATRSAGLGAARSDLVFLSDTVHAQLGVPSSGFLTVALPALVSAGRGGAVVVRAHPHRIRRTDPRRRP